MSPKLQIALPNKTITGNLKEAKGIKLNLLLGKIHDLSFELPYEVEKRNKFVKNENIDKTKERFLIKFTLGSIVEWFIINAIDEDMNEIDTKTVYAKSLPYELNAKQIRGYNVTSKNARTVLTDGLTHSIWSVGEINPEFDNRFRSFDVSEKTVLDFVFEVANTFGAIVDFDSENRKINLRTEEEIRRNRGMRVSYGNLLKSLNKKSDPDEMITQLNVYGKEGLSINRVNPTGSSSILSFAYFMYPFERDANKNTIQSSENGMSDDLCHAILDYDELVQSKKGEFDNLLSQQATVQGEITNLKNILAILQTDYEIIEDNLDIAKATEASNINQLKSELAAKKVEVDACNSQISSKQSQLNTILMSITNLKSLLSIENNFTPEQIMERNTFIIERTWTDDNIFDDEELYHEALKKFNEFRVPRLSLNISIINLFNVLEEHKKWDKLYLGEQISVYYERFKIDHNAMILGMNFDFDTDDISLEISDVRKSSNNEDPLLKKIYDSYSTATSINMSKYKWDKTSTELGSINDFINSDLDAAKRKILAGVNESVEISRRGILLSNPTNPEEVVILQSGIIALSETRGDTWQTAITAKGIVAERLMGRIIAGVNLFIENESGKFRFDGDGATIEGASLKIVNTDGSNMMDNWNAAEGNAIEHANQLKEQTDQEITDLLTDINNLDEYINGAFEDGLIESAEASAIEKYLNSLNKEKADVDNKYTTIYNQSDLTGTEKTNLASTKTSFNTAHTNLINSINTAIVDGKTTATEKTDVNAKFTSYRTALVNLNDAIQKALDKIYQTRTQRAEDNAKGHADTVNQHLREDLRIDAPLPTDIAMGSYGIRATTSDPNKYAQLDYRGLYIKGGAIQIDGGLPSEQVNIDIGTRNILTNSTWNLGKTLNWTGTSSNYTVLPPESDKPNSHIMRIESLSNASQNASEPFFINTGETYTISFDLKVDALLSSSTPLFSVRSFTDPSIPNAEANSVWSQYLLRFSDMTVAGQWVRLNYTFTPTAGNWLRVIPYNGSASSTAVNSYYREIQVEKGNKASDWSPAPQDVDNKIDNLDIGSSNILSGSLMNTAIVWGAGTTLTKEKVNGIWHIKNTYSGIPLNFGIQSSSQYRTTPFVAGKTYTLSFEVRGSVSSMDYVYIMRNDGNNQQLTILDRTVTSTTSFKKMKLTFNSSFTTEQGYILLGSTDIGSGKWLEIRKVQIEEGEKATAWSPNVLEVDSKVDSNDTVLRDDLKLTSPLPTNLVLNQDGITAYTSNSSNYARLDHRGLYIQGGAIQINGGLDDNQIKNASNWNNKTTRLTATGLYTGTVEADQIKVGTLTGHTITGAFIQGTEIVQSSSTRKLEMKFGRLQSFYDSKLAMDFGQYSLDFYARDGSEIASIVPNNILDNADVQGLSIQSKQDYVSIGKPFGNTNKPSFMTSFRNGYTNVSGAYRNTSQGSSLRLYGNSYPWVDNTIRGTDQPCILLDQGSDLNNTTIYYGGEFGRSASNFSLRYNNSTSTYVSVLEATNDRFKIYGAFQVLQSGQIRSFNHHFYGQGSVAVIPYTNAARLQYDTSNYITVFNDGTVSFTMGGGTKHAFFPDGTKNGGSVEVEGENYGMSPVDSPQVLLEYIEFDIPLTESGTKVMIDETYLKTVSHFDVFPNRGELVEKGLDYFILRGTGSASTRIVGERVDYQGAFYSAMDSLVEIPTEMETSVEEQIT